MQGTGVFPFVLDSSCDNCHRYLPSIRECFAWKSPHLARHIQLDVFSIFDTLASGVIICLSTEQCKDTYWVLVQCRIFCSWYTKYTCTSFAVNLAKQLESILTKTGLKSNIDIGITHTLILFYNRILQQLINSTNYIPWFLSDPVTTL